MPDHDDFASVTEALGLGDGTDVVHVSAAPRVLRRIAEELLDAADVACRREDAMTDPALPFEAVQ